MNVQPLSLSLTLTSLCALLFTGGVSLSAMEQADNHADNTAMKSMNSMCPMCDKPVGDKPEKVKITVGEGASAKSFFLACDSKMCSDEFMKNPEPVFQKNFSGKANAGRKTP